MLRPLGIAVRRVLGASLLLTGPTLGAAVVGASPATAQGVGGSYRIEVTAGGPYRATVGRPLTLQGRAAIAGQQKTVDDLEAIGRALVRYRDRHGSYPPAALTDAAGRPLLSWRVLLLPELGQEELYRRFDLTKPWDDPANRRLLAEIPAVYRAAGAPRRATNTAYAGVAGSKALFRSGGTGLDRGVARGEVGDGAEMTLAAGPVGPSVRIPWTAPGDVNPIESGRFGVASGFDGPGVVPATPMLFADGNVYSLPDTASTGEIGSWATIASGGCTPPGGASVDVGASWDLDGDGTFETPGASVTFTPSRSGTVTVRFRGTAVDGRSIVRSARLIVR